MIEEPPVVTYEVWERPRGKAPERRHERGFTRAASAQQIADDYNKDRVYLDRYEPEGETPSVEFFVVKATTTFEEECPA